LAKPKTALSHANKTSSESVDYRFAYNDRMKEVVADFYSKDVELFAYDFEGIDVGKQIARRDDGLLFKT
jgi:hypothetical protein